jgi:hypothetical protein
MANSEGDTRAAADVPLGTRRAALQGQIAHYMKSGYRVMSQTDTTAQLVRPKKFSLLIFVILLICAVFPAIVYIAYYVSKKDKTVYVAVDEWGNVSTM